MRAFSLWKQLKRKLRRNGRPVWTLASLMAVMGYGLLSGGGLSYVHAAPIAAPNQTEEIVNAIDKVQRPMKVHIHRTYLCGEEYRSLGLLSVERAKRAAQRPSVSFVRLNQLPAGTPVLVLEEKVGDLSEACKQSAVFGLDRAGRLTLYDGPPRKEKVVRTFYQLDVRVMESRLPKDELKRLTDGIRIEDKETYYSVLSSFSDFAIDASRDVMIPSRK
ncbi:BofC C-terminal domain-containing protein [Paenibacillus kobensis]|uniref:BofC C-terminal domain-containing protein n=1 Tax=Paenibacillus kobensis TaxID=59841 RepID=UPI000FDCBA5B|nr:BofC C-terminal domain-containing protein [Paenibacillus kobensis]